VEGEEKRNLRISQSPEFKASLAVGGIGATTLLGTGTKGGTIPGIKKEGWATLQGTIERKSEGYSQKEIQWGKSEGNKGGNAWLSDG